MAHIDILGIGEPLVEFNQVRGGDGRAYLQGFGGDTSNAVIAAARQGARAAYCTRVGDDEFGRMLLALWRTEGVDTSGVQVDPEAPTGLYFVTHGDDGHRFSYRRAGSAASLMRPEHLPRELIASARWLHASGISQAISPGARATVRAAIGIAREAGVKVSFDPNLRLRLWDLRTARDALLEVLPQVDLFLPSLDDVVQLSGRDDPDGIVDWCHAQGAPRVVLKLGERGALVSEAGVRAAVPAHRVEVLDATGAGDCFDGALLARLAAGAGLVDAARFAAAAAALSTTGYGAVDPLPTPAQVAAFIAAA
jgi:2-dehydro-3-deoxygluconokinase